ncbi:MAG: response regulator [Rhodanobacter sp.]|nr:MAG: response regulator [Rhodanobacter sp.]TAM14638.1 MAG: response regulator [Rhodanobacter sp.]TAM37430.1 MAG: response regulator [Rhodanobacter sp.]
MNSTGFLRKLLGSMGNPAAPATVWRKTLADTRVLVVDDSPTICAVLGRMLEQDGYAVHKAVDGEQAIELAVAGQPGLIFLDIVLPGVNGFAVLRTLRHAPQTAHIPIVMMSGNPQATEQFYVQRFGADDFIKKPFGRSAVQASIDTLVRAGRLPARPDEVVAMAAGVLQPAATDAPSESNLLVHHG